LGICGLPDTIFRVSSSKFNMCILLWFWARERLVFFKILILVVECCWNGFGWFWMLWTWRS
jgi:hypothetical protein